MENLFEMLNLQLFAGEGAGDGGAEGSADAGVNDAQEVAAPVSRRAKRENPNANTRYGVIEDEPRSQAAADTTENAEPEETFEMATGKGGRWEKAYKQSVSKIVSQRLGDEKALRTRLDAHQPIMQLLAQRYNIDVQDPANIDTNAVLSALEDDRRYYEDRAFREGVTPEQLMREEKLQRQQQAINAQRETEEREARMRNQYQNLKMQAVSLMADVPGFDLDAELLDKDFRRMVFTGTPVKAAYYAVHHEEIMRAQQQQQMQAAHNAVQQARTMTANAIASGTQRPSENGSTSAAPALHVTDPRKLTKAQRADLRARVKNGEKIIW